MGDTTPIRIDECHEKAEFYTFGPGVSSRSVSIGSGCPVDFVAAPSSSTVRSALYQSYIGPVTLSTDLFFSYSTEFPPSPSSFSSSQSISLLSSRLAVRSML